MMNCWPNNEPSGPSHFFLNLKFFQNHSLNRIFLHHEREKAKWASSAHLLTGEYSTHLRRCFGMYKSSCFAFFFSASFDFLFRDTENSDEERSQRRCAWGGRSSKQSLIRCRPFAEEDNNHNTGLTEWGEERKNPELIRNRKIFQPQSNL